jgi:rhodanese-related sulfurtransferase
MTDRDGLELTAPQVHAMMINPESAPLLIDCREESEWRTARIEGARLIPLGELTARADHIAAEAQEQGGPVIVHCHHGVRSLKGALMLRAHGIDARSMAGGIDAWSKEVDPAVPRY